ncbi:MAG: helix-turn-helix domain-containing protein [Candidatus Izemoplasmatales bacterium]|nr:helix-turn-helix domain-containing protein [Candidatus Izemoplasmatales bacterium]MDD5602356.1 helix-turn-helix domain-containing protein [Candidatus Izemoplasmatales bacterium]
MEFIGRKIRELRLENGLTQEELADRSELTKGFISQLERGLTSPSIATLQDLLGALGTNLAEFFANDEEDLVVFTADEFFEKTDEANKVKIHWIVPNAQKYEMEPILLELKPGGLAYDDEPHAGEEFGYVLEGEVTLKVGKRKFRVLKGQTFYYTSNKTHGLENLTNRRAVVLWVSTPPMF